MKKMELNLQMSFQVILETLKELRAKYFGTAAFISLYRICNGEDAIFSERVTSILDSFKLLDHNDRPFTDICDVVLSGFRIEGFYIYTGNPIDTSQELY